jgi:hypothetical protein
LEAVSADGIFETAAGVASLGGKYFVAIKTNEEVSACDPMFAYRQFEGVEFRDYRNPRPIFVPVHDACLQIAKRVIHQRTQKADLENSHQKVTSMRRLWEVLESRFAATGDIVYDSRARIRAPFNYHMPRNLGGYDWSEDEGTEEELEVSLIATRTLPLWLLTVSVM